MRRTESLSTVPRFPGVFEYRKGILSPVVSSISHIARVRNRLLLHELGFTQMFTAIVQPDEVLNIEDLRYIARCAERVNADIGLPTPVNSLVIRTRDYDTRAKRLGGTNPMLIIDDVHGRVSMKSNSLRYGFEILDGLANPLAWWQENRIENASVFLVHEENLAAQKAAIHGRVGILSDNAYEISFGDNVAHARAIGNNGDPYASMFGHDLGFMLQMVSEGRGAGLFGFGSNDWSHAQTMATEVLRYADDLYEALCQVTGKAGQGPVLEWRLYRGKQAEAGMQIYDFDKELG